MYRLKNAIMIIGIIFLLAGCSGNKSVENKNTPHHKAVAEPALCIIMFDGTASYKHLDKAKRTATRILNELPSGSKVYVRWITDDSQSDKNGIISAQLNEIKKPKNAFDVREKQHYAIAVAKAKRVRQDINAAITEAVSPKATRTDIYGAIATASTRFEGNCVMKPMLVLMTDMDDNVKKNDIPINLNGANVRIMDFQVGSNEAQLKKHWREYLMNKGASTVEFAYLDDPYKGGK